MAASEQQRKAHRLVLLWSHALSHQVDRLHADRTAVLASTKIVRDRKFYGHDDAWPFYVVEADKHFTMVAARQLLRALRAFDGNDRLPATMTRADVRLVRDALEHWDEPYGRANTAMSERGADPAAHSWNVSGHGVLSETIKDSALREWAAAVYDEIVKWDPW